MNIEKIREINRRAIEEARKALGVVDESSDLIWAFVTAVVVYIALYYTKPEFLMVADEQGNLGICKFRIIGASVGAGILMHFLLQMS